MKLSPVVVFFSSLCFAQDTVPFATRIINGDPAIPGQFPFFAHIRSRSSGIPGTLELCGGTLISPYKVLTAAHCCYCDSAASDVLLFELALNLEYTSSVDFSIIGDACTEIHNTTIRTCHPSYNANTIANDFCLLTLNEPAKYTPVVVYNSATMTTLSPHPDSAGQSAVIIGFGKNASGPVATVLHKAVITIANSAECVSIWEGGALVNPTTQICGNTSNSKTVCQGDSGGPLFTKLTNGQFLLLGVVSFGPSVCTTPDVPAIYGRVDSTVFRSWATPLLTSRPTSRPTKTPTGRPTRKPTLLPTTKTPTYRPTTRFPTALPTKTPNSQPTTKLPTTRPTTKFPTVRPSKIPTNFPTTRSPTSLPSTVSSPTFASTCVSTVFP